MTLLDCLLQGQNEPHARKKSKLTLQLPLMLAFAMFAAGPVIANKVQGLDNPTLSYNLAAPQDFNPGLQFLDLTKMMRPWIGHENPRAWGGMNSEELRAAGHLDSDGWVKSIPPGFDRVGTIWNWSGFRETAGNGHAGTYVATYDGEGSIDFRGDARVVSTQPGRIVFENADAGTIILDITQTDPNDTGDYIRNISIVPQEHLDLFASGATFNPDWLELVKDARELRFMNWTGTNNATLSSWDDVTSPQGPFSGRGVAVEDMVKLSNELGVDPWFTMPHLADDTYIRNFALYVRDNLDPALTVRVEYSNEVWNFAFAQTRWLRDQAVAEWGTADAYIDYHAKKAVETALIWEDVFGGETDRGRLVNVLGTLMVNDWLTNRLLDAPMWRENEPNAYVDPKTVFEEIAVTTYFGVTTISNEELRNKLFSIIQDPNIDAQSWLASQLLDPDYGNSIPQITEFLEEISQIARDNGMRMVGYEGGQHLHHSFAVAGLTEADIKTMNDFMIGFVRSSQMADLYQVLWDVWAKHGDGAFMQFTDIGSPSKWGSWGLRSSLNDETPRSRLLENLNASTQPWWDGAQGGSFRQQGVIVRGTAGDDTLIGTSQEDYLLGGDGYDTFNAGNGNDGINGGEGYDTLVLSGDASDYTLRIDGDGYRVVGPDGSNYTFDVEALVFDNNQIVRLADLAITATGILELPTP